MIDTAAEAPARAAQDAPYFYTIQDVIRLSTFSQSTIYEKEAAGKFPRRCFPFGDRSVRWLKAEIDEWVRCAAEGRPWRPAPGQDRRARR